jgi:hypothetical protein
MLLLRLILILAALTIAVSGALYLLTRRKHYLNFATRIVRLLVVSLLVIGLLFILERYVLIGWRVLF